MEVKSTILKKKSRENNNYILKFYTRDMLGINEKIWKTHEVHEEGVDMRVRFTRMRPKEEGVWWTHADVWWASCVIGKIGKKKSR